MVYIFIFIFLLIQSILLDFYKLKVSKKWIWIFNLILFVSLVGFRYKLGGDTFNYMNDFENFPTLDKIGFSDLFGLKYSPLWVLLFSLVKTIFTDFLFFQILHAVFVNGIIFWFISRYCKYKFLAIFFYFFYFYFYFNTEILRESLSICFFLLSVPSFLKGNWVKYYLCVLIAILFHYSALILILFPLLKNVNLNVVKMFLLGIALYFVPKLFLEFLPPFIKMYYEEYVVYQANLGGYLYASICFILFPLLVIKLDKHVINSRRELFVFASVFFSIAVYSFISPSIALRFFNYLFLIVIVFFVNFSGALITTTRIKRFSLLFFIPCVLLYKSKEYFADTSEILVHSRFYIRWYPYTTVFTKDWASQKRAVEMREKWVDAHFVNLVEDLKELL